jgi:hypothetical protein
MLRLLAGVITFLLLIVTAFLIYASRRPQPMLFYSGAAIEVPQGRIWLVVMNPFRDRTSEHTAERLIGDLKTDNCPEIIKEFSNDNRICPTVQGSHSERLIWRQDGPFTRVLVYDLTGKHARLWITFTREESGFGVRNVSLVR